MLYYLSPSQTEMEVSYFPRGGSITDYVCELYDVTVGVSVTRAMKFSGEFTAEDAERLLNKKLKGMMVWCILVMGFV